MLVRDAKIAARQWVMDEGRKVPGLHGAFYHGSINWLADEAVLPATSDLDLMIVVTGSDPPSNLGKFIYRGVLLEVSNLSKDQVKTPEQILGTYPLAGSFRAPSIILNPSGELSRLQAAVSRDYAQRSWVRKRCEHARSRVLNRLQIMDESDQFHDQVTAWLFAAGVTTHVLLVAGLKNPTVRRRYVAMRELLEEYNRMDLYARLLDMLGCGRINRRCVKHHLDALAEAFDAAKTVLKTPYRFAADIGDCGRVVAIEGSRELIERGLHREALFWMVATYSRCQWVLSHDAPGDVQERFSRGYRSLLADLGITNIADLNQRGEQIRESLPRVWEVAEATMAENPEIRDWLDQTA